MSFLTRNDVEQTQRGIVGLNASFLFVLSSNMSNYQISRNPEATRPRFRVDLSPCNVTGDSALFFFCLTLCCTIIDSIWTSILDIKCMGSYKLLYSHEIKAILEEFLWYFKSNITCRSWYCNDNWKNVLIQSKMLHIAHIWQSNTSYIRVIQQKPDGIFSLDGRLL